MWETGVRPSDGTVHVHFEIKDSLPSKAVIDYSKVSQDEVAKYLGAWDVFVLSSLWEGLPCSVVEARMAHLPVVAYDVGGIAEVISDGVNGYLVAPKDWQQLAHKMICVANDSRHRSQLGEHPDNLDAFENSEMIRAHFQLYKSLYS